MSWDEAKERCADIADWRQCVALCVFDMHCSNKNQINNYCLDHGSDGQITIMIGL